MIWDYLPDFFCKDLCCWSHHYAVSVWKKLIFCKKTGNCSMSETTITEELIYRFWRLAKGRKYPVSMLLSKNESANGNDIEICIETLQGYVLMPCQAKMLYDNSTYTKMGYQVNGVYQIDLLISYARRMGGIPIYFLYNFCFDKNIIRYLQQKFRLNIQELGCSIHFADFIRTNYTNLSTRSLVVPTFFDLHDRMSMPFSRLFCDFEQSIFGSGPFPGPVKFYSYDDIRNTELWRDMAPPAAIGRVTTDEVRYSAGKGNDEELPYFNPMYRILISLERRGATITRYE
jgi:hypothetical protein